MGTIRIQVRFDNATITDVVVSATMADEVIKVQDHLNATLHLSPAKPWPWHPSPDGTVAGRSFSMHQPDARKLMTEWVKSVENTFGKKNVTHNL